MTMTSELFTARGSQIEHRFDITRSFTGRGGARLRDLYSQNRVSSGEEPRRVQGVAGDVEDAMASRMARGEDPRTRSCTRAFISRDGSADVSDPLL